MSKNTFLGPVVFVGRAGAGKSTAARMLERYGAVLVKFAGPLKDMMRALRIDEDYIEGGLKEQPCEALCGKSARFAMQTLGTDWGRKTMGEDFWVNAWRRQVAVVINNGYLVVSDDCRFPNEAKAVKEMGGVLVRIIRPGHEGIGLAHESEQYVDKMEVDYTLLNPGDMYGLEGNLKSLFGVLNERL